MRNDNQDKKAWSWKTLILNEGAVIFPRLSSEKPVLVLAQEATHRNRYLFTEGTHHKQVYMRLSHGLDQE